MNNMLVTTKNLSKSYSFTGGSGGQETDLLYHIYIEQILLYSAYDTMPKAATKVTRHMYHTRNYTI